MSIFQGRLTALVEKQGIPIFLVETCSCVNHISSAIKSNRHLYSEDSPSNSRTNDGGLSDLLAMDVTRVRYD